MRTRGRLDLWKTAMLDPECKKALEASTEKWKDVGAREDRTRPSREDWQRYVAADVIVGEKQRSKNTKAGRRVLAFAELLARRVPTHLATSQPHTDSFARI